MSHKKYIAGDVFISFFVLGEDYGNLGSGPHIDGESLRLSMAYLNTVSGTIYSVILPVNDIINFRRRSNSYQNSLKTQ